jgi:uncharacterized protein
MQLNLMKQLPPMRPNHSWHRLKAVAMALGLATLTFAPPTFAQEKMWRTLSVTGRGTEAIPATLTVVRLGVEAQGKTANAVQEQVARRSTAVVTLLKSRGVEKLQTTGINLNPVYRYDNNTQTLTGYTASNVVSFRITTDKAGTLLDDAVQAGASRIDGVSFTATDEAIAAAQKQALRKATQDAQQQADSVLSALNLTRKDIVGVQINAAFSPPPPIVFQRAEVGFAANKAQSPVIGGEQPVEGTVTLQISY